MLRNSIFTILFLCLAFVHSSFVFKKQTPKEYIEKYKGDAIKEMKRSGVPASITLAQGMLESGYGNSRLARKANNHFGIKCHSDWKGPTIKIDDDAKNECFRKYKTVWHSYRDHSDFLKGKSRYASLFDLKITDYKGWAKGLRKAGYATNQKYASLLITLIERHDLNQYVKKAKGRKNKKNKKSKEPEIVPVINEDEDEDEEYREENRSEEEGDDEFVIEVLPSNDVKRSANWISYIKVKKGDTYYSVAKANNIPLNRLYKYNECNSDTVLKIGTPLYLQPKRARGTEEVHYYAEGDNLYRISQRYGIKLKHLYRRNKWEGSHIPQNGDKILLKK